MSDAQKIGTRLLDLLDLDVKATEIRLIITVETVAMEVISFEDDPDYRQYDRIVLDEVQKKKLFTGIGGCCE